MRRWIVCVGFVMILLTPLAIQPAWADKVRPNILVIYSDDHGWADLGIQGADVDINTPHLDQLARDGVRFTRGYVSAPQCVPSRAGVIAGRYQQRFGVEDNNKGPLPAEEVTIAERLQRAGYATGMVGKWHLDIGGPKGETKTMRTIESSSPHQQGFAEYWRGELRSFQASHDLQGIPFPDAPRTISDDRFRIVVQTDAALSFLERRARKVEQPWFLYLAWYAPHVPLDSPEPWYSQTPRHLPQERRQALSMIAAMDDGLRQIREKLRSMNQEERTLIFFIGDNGAPVKPGAWNGSLNAPLVGEKGMLTDGGIRVPFLAAWPGTIPFGIVYDKPVINLDVAATAVAVARIPHDEKLDGVNLIPFVTGNDPGMPHQTLYWRWRSQAAILEYPWKMIWLGNRQRYLFDTAQPEGELAVNNLVDQYPDVARKLEAKWKDWSQELQPAGPAESGNDQDNLFYAAHVEKTGAMPVRRAKNAKEASSTELPPLGGWLCRGGSLSVKDGQLVVTPDATSKGGPFLTINQLEIVKPQSVTITLKTARPGVVAFAWRSAEQKDFLPENRLSFSTETSDWETHQLELPQSDNLLHLRLHLPPGKSIVRSIEIRSANRPTIELWKQP